MSLLRSFPLLAFALVLLSIVGLCVAQASVGLLLVAGALAATSWYVTEGPRGRSLPRWVSNVLVLAVSLNVVVDLVQHPDDFLGVLGRFTVWLTLIKLYERRAPRDYAQLLALSLLLMLTGSLQSSELLFGVILLAYAVLGLYVLLLYQLHAAHERSTARRREAVPPEYRLAPPSRPVIGRHVGLHFRVAVVVVGAAGLVLGGMVFVSFPRDVGRGVVSTLSAPGGGRRTGFRPEVDLLGSTRITASRAKVMDLRLLDAEGRPVRADNPLLLRGAVLSRYDESGRWEPSRRDVEVEVLTPSQPLYDGAASSPTLEVQLHTYANTLFSLLSPVAVHADDVEWITYSRRTQLLGVPAGAGRLQRYRVVVAEEPTDNALAQLAESSSAWFRPRARYANEAVAELARALLQEADRPRPRRSDGTEAFWRWSTAAAARFTDFLRSDAFTYTLDTSDVVLDPDRDPVEQFLTELRRGHCEFFASGLTALCHTAGINARLVTGYVAWEYDEEAQAYVVLESNAHAWVEVRTGPSRWTTFDPTPPATLRALHGGERDLSDRLRWFYQRLEGGWSSGIVEFNRETQSDFAARLDRGWSERLARGLDATRDWMRRVNRAFYFGPAGYIWMGIVALALIIAVIALVRLMRRTRRLRDTLRLRHLRGHEHQRLLRQLGFYLDMLLALQRGGLAKPDWQPPRQYAEDLARRRADVAQVVVEVTDLFYAARYGGRHLAATEVARARSRVQALAGLLRGRA